MIFFIFLLGLAIGSFLNVVILRLGREDGIIGGRSHCPNCGKILKWYELLPLFSFLIQRGKCRDCKQRISLQYPIVELATGFLFLSFFKIFSYQLPITGYQLLIASYQLLIISLLIVIFVYDLKHYIIPNKIVYLGIIVAFLYNIFNFIFKFQLPVANYFFSGFLAASFFLSMVLVSRGRWMGMGDVKLVMMMGLFLGWPKILSALLIAFWSGAIIGLLLIFLKKKDLKGQIPFGPFLVLGTILSLFISDLFLKNYLEFLI